MSLVGTAPPGVAQSAPQGVRIPGYGAQESIGSALATQFRVIWALTLREFRTKILGHKLGAFMALAEPFFFVLSVSFAVSFIDKQAKIGTSFILFFATGVIPFNSYRRVAKETRSAVKRYKKCLYIPIVRPIDPFIAVAIIQLLLYISIYLTFFVGYFLVTGHGLPHDWGATFFPLVICAMLGLGSGLINTAICSYFPPWDKFFAILMMPLFLISGVLHPIHTFPSYVQDILYWNPLAHAVVASRNGYFDIYEYPFYDPYYFVGFSVTTLFIGLVAERFARRRILETS
jgi:capsular polysaccharide transport system permease protein